jgi:hypothetical protein
MKKYIITFSVFILSFPLFFILSSHTTDEGMFPLTEISKLDLAKAGLKIPVSELYNPNGTSLVDAIVHIGGCTGSFISNDGLVITNHHCGFSSVSAASDSTHNYLRDGFYAETKDKELKTGLTTKTIDSYSDVSALVLNGAADATSDLQRTNIIKTNIRALLKQESEKNKTLDYEISEMFTGRTYILFRYQTLTDIRIVYNPPRAIGEFGGETDNWVWPRHNGDFCILRAYVAPDGKPAAYDKSNIPYHPKKFLKVNAKGVKENDFVFILGYPGTTFRHMPSQFIEYQQKYQLPFIADLFEWQIAKMEELSKQSVSKELFYASKIKGLANTSKNYRGKLQGLARTHLLDKKRENETYMKGIIEGNANIKRINGTLFDEIQSAYDELFARADKSLWFQQVYSRVNLMDAASDYVYLKKIYMANDSLNLKKTKMNIEAALAMYNEEAELPMLAHMIDMALHFPKEQTIEAVQKYFGGLSEDQVLAKLKKMIAGSIMNDRIKVKASMDKNSVKALKYSDEFLRFNEALNIEFDADQSFFAAWRPKVAGLIKRYNDLEMLVNVNTYMPDANSTMRLTYGYVKGYSPQDAVYDKPFTTLKGILEKETPTGDFVMPPLLKQIIEKRDYGQWYDKELDDVAVALLYNLDTTGGNSGSPVMDAEGNFIGINFDRAFTATINDYAWNENYSRSIGCDVRYICFILDKYSHADGLLKEMGVK